MQLASFKAQPQFPALQLKPAGHALPHAPQLVTRVRSVSQPSSAAGAVGRLQLPLFGRHVELQRPAAHVAASTPPPEQTR